MKRKSIGRAFICTVVGLLPVLSAMMILFPPPASAVESPKETATIGNAPRFIPPDPDEDIRRRERSVEEGGTRGYARGLTRGYARGLTRGYARGLTRGYARGLTRGYARGLTRGYARGLTRGYARGLTRGYARGLTRGYARGLTRGYARGLTRGFAAEEIARLTRRLPEAPEPASDTEEAPTIPTPPATIAPLAPQRTGLSASAQPVLYWYVSAPWSGRIEFTLNRVDRIDPLILTPLDPPEREGIYAVRLGDYGIGLEPDVEYEWFVSIIPLPEERSFDFLAGAPIRYAPLSPGQRVSADPPDRDTAVAAYAAEGYWYDAVDLLCTAIERAPMDRRLRSRRAALMDQVDLPPVAAYDREPLSPDARKDRPAVGIGNQAIALDQPIRPSAR